MPKTLAETVRDGWLAKAADPNDAQDQPFEAAFSNLAHAYLKDRAPALLDYEVGFQLVDRNDDNTKAVGILGFKAGSNWLYAPVFFINGDLKGHELLYVKNQDAFVPLDEGWVDHLLAKKPASLGEGVNRDTKRLGVHYPDMFRALQSPHKYASVLDEVTPTPTPTPPPAEARNRPRVTWAAGEKAALAAAAAGLRAKLASVDTGGFRAATKDWAVVAVAAMAKHAAAEAPYRAALLDALAAGGVDAVADLHAAFQAYPRLKTAFDAFYPAGDVAAVLDFVRANPGGTARPRAKRAAAPAVTGSVLTAAARDARRAVTSKVEVHRFGGFGKAASVLLTGDDKERLVRDGLLIKDARGDDEVTHCYAVPTRVEYETKFTTPNETGLYDVLSKDGTLAKCLVVVGPVGPSGGAGFATVVGLGEGRKAWLNIHQSYVWVAQQYKGWAAWYEALPEARDLARGKGLYMLIGPDGRGSLPFRVVADLGGDATGGDQYEVDFEDYAAKSRAGGAAGGMERYFYGEGDPGGYSKWRDGQRVHLGQKTGTRFRVDRGDVYAPAGFKLIRLDPDEADDGKDRAGDPVCGGDAGQSDRPPLVLGDAIDVETQILRKNAALRVKAAASGFAVSGRDRTLSGLLTADDAVVYLVTGHGLREGDAREALKQASAARDRGHAEAAFLLKYADAYGGGSGSQPGGRTDPYLTAGGPYAPDMVDPTMGNDDVMGSAVPAQHPLEESLPVTDLRADPRNRDAYDPVNPDPAANGVAMDAADKGQKEVFDTAMIGALLKSTRDDSMVDKFMKPMEECLDAIGRQLFIFYWHGDRFAERFGDAEMPEFEDSLRNTFENLGQLVLFEKQKSVDANPSESAADTNLDEVANQ